MQSNDAVMSNDAMYACILYPVLFFLLFSALFLNGVLPMYTF